MLNVVYRYTYVYMLCLYEHISVMLYILCLYAHNDYEPEKHFCLGLCLVQKVKFDFIFI